LTFANGKKYKYNVSLKGRYISMCIYSSLVVTSFFAVEITTKCLLNYRD
jgi:hypothetical protein